MPSEMEKPMGALDAVKKQLLNNRPARLGTHETNWNTLLNEEDEMKYQQYKKSLGERGDDTHYDLRGYWLKYGKHENLKNPEAHFTDEFKKPSYATFSKDSYYHNSINPDGSMNIGGEWVGDNKFIPSQEMWDNEYKKNALFQHQAREQKESISTGKGFIIEPPSNEPINVINYTKDLMKNLGSAENKFSFKSTKQP